MKFQIYLLFQSRKETGESYEALQQEHNELLRKYAEAENVIDELRIGARVSLYYDSPVMNNNQSQSAVDVREVRPGSPRHRAVLRYTIILYYSRVYRTKLFNKNTMSCYENTQKPRMSSMNYESELVFVYTTIHR